MVACFFVVVRRILIVVLWLIVIAALAGAMRLPAFGLIIKDRYVVVSNPSLILIVLLALGLPILAFTIGVGRHGKCPD